MNVLVTEEESSLEWGWIFHQPKQMNMIELYDCTDDFAVGSGIFKKL